jgi:asparagine synthase (glutamine-hydrolysing)
MCGINGFNFNDASLVCQMNEIIKHRGPDGSGHKTFSKASISNVRLAIIDLSENGKQPISNEDESIHIVFNGEIYNFKEIRASLKRKHRFRSNTDTEVILHYYEEKGTEILNNLNGMFAFCIYDSKKDEFFLARDRIGMKPIYYFYDGNRFIFSSEIKALFTHDIARVPNYDAIIEYMTFQHIIDDKTFFKNIYQLQPGKYVTLKKGKLSVNKYWDVKFEYKQRSEKELLSEFRKTFDRCVRRHMISDVELGCYLSGGFDSTSVATLCSKAYDKKLKTFTGAFEHGPEYDERECSRAVAKRIGAEQFETVITAKDFINNIEKIIYHLDEPRVGMGPFPQYSVSKLVSQHVKVVLTGHGGDELFAGYPILKAYYIKERIKKNPFYIFKSLKNLRREDIPFILHAFFGPIIKRDMRNGMTLVLFSDKEREKLFTKEFIKKNRFNPQDSVEKEIGSKNLNSYELVQYFFLRSYLPNLFNIEDKVGMAFSIEARIPYCDKEMIEFALSIPMEQKLSHNTNKFIVKEAMRKDLPAILYKQKKKGFPTPLEHMFRKELKKYVCGILTSKQFAERGIFNQEYVQELLDQHMGGKNRSLHIWSLLCVELWFRIFIDPKDPLARYDKR